MSVPVIGPRRLAAVPATGPALVPTMTERQLQQAIIDLCRWLHLLCYHTHDSRRSARGFPDLVIVGPLGILFRELKATTGRVGIDQKCWGQGIAEAGGDYGVWRPEDWHTGRIRAEIQALTPRIGHP